MTTIVVDTNVLVSRLLSSEGAPATLMTAWETGAISVLVSEAILQEYRRVLSYPRIARRLDLTPVEVDAFIARLCRLAIMVTPTVKVSAIAADPEDDKFLECALAGGADYIVSGDDHLLDLGRYEWIENSLAGSFPGDLRTGIGRAPRADQAEANCSECASSVSAPPHRLLIEAGVGFDYFRDAHAGS